MDDLALSTSYFAGRRLAPAAMAAAVRGFGLGRVELGYLTRETEVEAWEAAVAAEGLTVRAQAQYNHRLFWDSVCRVGEEPQTETAYAFYPDQHQTDRPASYAGVEM